GRSQDPEPAASGRAGPRIDACLRLRKERRQLPALVAGGARSAPGGESRLSCGGALARAGPGRFRREILVRRVLLCRVPVVHALPVGALPVPDFPRVPGPDENGGIGGGGLEGEHAGRFRPAAEELGGSAGGTVRRG